LIANGQRMHVRQTHPWDVTPKEAIAIQRRLAGEVRLEENPALASLHSVAGVDVGFEEEGRITRAAIAVLDHPGLQLVEHVVVRVPTSFPYIPGLLSFRELPAVLQAVERLRQTPQVFLCDGQGIAHPRRLGIASHLGVLLDRPTIGVAKTRLVGTYEEPGEERGAWSCLMDHGECIGAVLRSRSGVKPIYISPGHKLSLRQSIAITMACSGRYKLPETTRWAHRLASDKRYRDSQ
jgi:deoxyribonuclease V